MRGVQLYSCTRVGRHLQSHGNLLERRTLLRCTKNSSRPGRSGFLRKSGGKRTILDFRTHTLSKKRRFRRFKEIGALGKLFGSLVPETSVLSAIPTANRPTAPSDLHTVLICRWAFAYKQGHQRVLADEVGYSRTCCIPATVQYFERVITTFPIQRPSTCGTAPLPE